MLFWEWFLMVWRIILLSTSTFTLQDENTKILQKSQTGHPKTFHHIPQTEQSDPQITQIALLYSPVPNKASQRVAILSVSNVTHNLIISPNGFQTPNWNLSANFQHYQLKYKTRHYCDTTNRTSQCTYCLSWKWRSFLASPFSLTTSSAVLPK
jgi:hypothetical protein